jgi:hypothetical protein
MSLLPSISVVFLETIIAPLIPWYLTAAGGDLELARETILTMLASYNVDTEQEARLAVEIAFFSLGAMAALGKSMDPDLPLNAVLRLRGSANALQRSKHQCQRVLDGLRKERRMAGTAPKPQHPIPEQTPEQPGIADAAQSVQPAAAQPAAIQPKPEFTLTRQQRRAVERAVEKAQRKHAEQLRRDAMRLSRTASAPPATMASPRNTQSPTTQSDLVAAHHP